MKILFVSQELPPETGWGGIGTYVDVLSEALAAKGLEVHVLSVVAHQARKTTTARGVTIHRHPLPGIRGPNRIAPETWIRVWLPLIAARLIDRLRLSPTVIECPEYNAEGLVLSLRGTTPLVVRLHSTARQLFPYTGQGRKLWGIDGRVAARLEEGSARRANAVVSTQSNLVEVTDLMRLDEAALHAIPYPVRPRVANTVPDVNPPRVTFVGRLERRKGPEVLLRAAPKVLAVVPDARFVFVGGEGWGIEPGAPPSATWLRREAERLGIAHAIEVCGRLDRSGVANQIRRATVCAFPSRWESFGNVVAEAASARRPVVVSSIPPFRDLVHDGVSGRIVPREDAEAWATALVEVLSSRERALAMGEAGAALVASISDPARVADLALASYEHAIERWQRRQLAGLSRGRA